MADPCSGRALNLDACSLCRKVIESTSKFDELAARKCHMPGGHNGKCREFPFLRHLETSAPKVAEKIKRDAIMTTGAAWKSKEAGPNRILRWVMLSPDDVLLKYGIDMSRLKPQVVAKLRDKAAPYDSCIQASMWLTYLVYQMGGAPECPCDLRDYLTGIFGGSATTPTCCTVCRQPLTFAMFGAARRGKAEIETSHKDPRQHAPGNVGFAHRACNIAQGPKTVEEFYDWIEAILRRTRPSLFR